MCCPLGQTPGKLTIQTITREESSSEEIYHVKAIYDHADLSLADRIILSFQRMETLEKVAEMTDELFHLGDSFFQAYANLKVYETLSGLHHGVHHIEHTLHSFCFFGDIAHWIITGTILEYDHEELNYLRSIARSSHIASHFFETLQFLAKLQLCQLGRFERIVKQASLLSAIGYGLWTISLIWDYCYPSDEHHHSSLSDMAIHMGGFLFTAIPLTKKIEALSPYTSFLNKAASIAGIVHAWSLADRLLNPTIKLKVDFIIQKEEESGEELEEDLLKPE